MLHICVPFVTEYLCSLSTVTLTRIIKETVHFFELSIMGRIHFFLMEINILVAILYKPSEGAPGRGSQEKERSIRRHCRSRTQSVNITVDVCGIKSALREHMKDTLPFGTGSTNLFFFLYFYHRFESYVK